MGKEQHSASPVDATVRGWIPTAETQPTKSGTYAFVTVAARGRKKKHVTFASYWITGKHHAGETGWADMDDCELGSVIAWMPMPEPYAPNVEFRGGGAQAPTEQASAAVPPSAGT